MFGVRECPKTTTRVRDPSHVPDIQMPCPQPNSWAHMGRAPDSDRHVRALLFKQMKEADHGLLFAANKAQKLKDELGPKFDAHVESKRFKQEIAKRVEVRARIYEDAIDKRREKLKEMLAKEEREFYRETVDAAQRGGESQIETMKLRAQELIAKRECDRLEVVKEKRLQQYMERCLDLRTTLSKKNTVESKYAQLQQIRENESRREAEREYDKMWHELSIKEQQAKKEREEYEALTRFMANKDNKEVWQMQIKGKKLVEMEAEQIAQEDRVEVDKLIERLRKEEMDALIEKRRKRDKIDQELREQLMLKHKFLAQRKKEEDDMEHALTLLTELEFERERAKSTTEVAKAEMEQYMTDLKKMNEERKQEEKKLDELMTEHGCAVQATLDEAKCKIEAAKEKLKQDTLKGIADQIQYKKDMAIEQLKQQRAENELARMAHETNEQLVADTARQELMARMQYKNDLLKQIEYNKLIQERERQDLERRIEIGRQEEERFVKLVQDICVGGVEYGIKHPFRRVIERYDCQCPLPITKPPY